MDLAARAQKLVGQIVGGHHVHALIGAGGMGVVYRATQLRLKAPAALKILPGGLAHDPKRIALFKREATAIASLRGRTPHVVQVYDFDWDPVHKVYFLSMELVEGAGLDDVLERLGPLEEDLVLRIGRQASVALELARRHGITHRDVKPANILISKAGHAKVTDFGLAALETQRLDDTRGAIVGTPAYMSPEQARGDEHVDHRSDVYSLGATLYAMLTGETPFKADSPFALASTITNSPIPDPRRLMPKVSAEMAGLLTRMLGKRPEDRPQNTAEVVTAIDAILASRPAPPEPDVVRIARLVGGEVDAEALMADSHPSARIPQITTGGPPVTRRWLPFALVAAVAVAVAVPVGVLLASGGGKPPAPPTPAAPPTIRLAITAPARDAVVASAGVTVQGRVEGPSEAWVRVNGRSVGVDGGTFAETLTLTEGRHDLTIQAGVGALTLANATVPVVADGGPPAIAVEPLPALTREARVVLRGTVQDASLRHCRLDGQPLALTDGAFEVPCDLVEGERVFAIEAVDALERRSTWKGTVLCDRTAPRLDVGDAPTEAVAGEVGTFDVSGTAPEPGTHLEVNGTAVTPGPDGAFTQRVALGPGENRVVVVATDAAGNRAEVVRTILGETLPEGFTRSGATGVYVWARDGAEMVQVPAGACWLGARRGWPDAKAADQPRVQVRLRRFFIDRTEVTRGAYGKFLAWVRTEATGAPGACCHRDEPKAADHAARHVPKGFGDPARDPGLPVTGVDWWDAYAYARWAGKTLPTEAQWERAATWDPERPAGEFDVREYPWGAAKPGEVRANCSTTPHPERKWGGLAPADAYPEGRAPCGALNLAGNAWEWCADAWRTDPRKGLAPLAPDPWTEPAAAAEARVVRGGGYKSNLTACRVYLRNGSESLPGERSPLVGFRCVVVP